jgi:hypothetical protein
VKNPERRAALDKARRQALFWAETAEEAAKLHRSGDEHTKECQEMAKVWAAVGEVMKVGDERADNV